MKYSKQQREERKEWLIKMIKKSEADALYYNEELVKLNTEL